MTAGSGVTHTERSHPDDLAISRGIHGIQTWVALPDEAEEGKPSFVHAPESEIPFDTLGRSTVRVAAGSGWGLDSPVTGSSPLILAEVTLDASSPLPMGSDLTERSVLALEGDVWVNDERIASGQLVVLRSGATVTLSGSGTALILGGEPVGKRHIWWNFVHSDLDRIEQAKSDWLEQRFPIVPDDHDPFVPLPA